MIYKIIKNIIRFVFALLTVYILLFVFFIYPNDKRIPVRDVQNLQSPGHPRKKISSVFINSLKTTYEEQTRLDYNERIQKIKDSYSNHLNFDSARMQSPYQIFLNLGSYPYFLEGRDSILLSSPQKFVVFPNIEGDVEIDFGLVSLFSNSKFVLYHNDQSIFSYENEKISTPENASSFFHKNFIRYAFPDRKVQGGRWSDQRVKLALKSSDSISFLCESEKDGCFISEPTFWMHDTNPPSSKIRNIVYVLVDTLRYDALDSPHAPFLKSLQKRSTCFDNAMGAGNMTSISTNALLSCQRPSKIPDIAFTYGIPRNKQEEFYKKETPSFPTFLQKNGIKTAMIGNVSILSEVLGIGVNHGFDDQISIEMEGYDTAHITNASIEWLQKNANDPFFLYVHYNSTHAPYRAPLHDIFSTLNGFRSFASQREFLLALYQAEIRYADRNLALLDSAIQKLGLDKNTVFIVNSDHGDSHELRTYSENTAGPAYTGSIFDHVGTLLYNDVIHVPLLISNVGQTEGSHVSEMASSLDIGPSILDLFGLSTPSWCDGVSLLTENHLKNRNVIGVEGEDQRAIFYKNRYKFFRSYSTSEKKLTPEAGYFIQEAKIFVGDQLFDLKSDPAEQTNLISTHPELFHELKDAFNRYYNIQDNYFLVVDSPKIEDIEIEEGGSNQTFKVDQSKRKVIPYNGVPRILPKIKIGGQSIPIRFSSMRLPLQHGAKFLVGEEISIDQISISLHPSAFLIKMQGDQSFQRKINFGNSSFENIFKEWGYLNDGN